MINYGTFDLDTYPNNCYKQAYLNNAQISITIFNLISLGDRDEETRREIARQGGKASGKTRQANALTVRQLQIMLNGYTYSEKIKDIINSYNGRYKDLIDINNPETVTQYLPLRLLGKIQAIANRQQREVNAYKKLAEEYASKTA